MEQLHHALSLGPGVFVMREMIPQETVDRAERVTQAVRKAESGFGSKASGRTFAYNQKHAVYDPESFADYYGNDMLYGFPLVPRGKLTVQGYDV